MPQNARPEEGTTVHGGGGQLKLHTTEWFEEVEIPGRKLLYML